MSRYRKMERVGIFCVGGVLLCATVYLWDVAGRGDDGALDAQVDGAKSKEVKLRLDSFDDIAGGQEWNERNREMLEQAISMYSEEKKLISGEKVDCRGGIVCKVEISYVDKNAAYRANRDIVKGRLLHWEGMMVSEGKSDGRQVLYLLHKGYVINEGLIVKNRY